MFPSVAAFAAYVGSKEPSARISIDYMPPNGGPQDAPRVGVTMAGAARAAPKPAEAGGLSTGTKVAIGLGAAALFGCYKLGCFHRRTPATQ